MDVGRFEGTTTLVTGASRGIGLAIAQRIVADGGRVVITARGQEALDAAVEGLGGSDVAVGIAGKADDPAHREEVLARIAEMGGLDHLVNNAGINPAYGPALEIEDSVVHKILDVNVVGALAWTRDCVAAGLRGAIVNISSVSALGAAPGIAFYGVSKAALMSLTQQLAFELAPSIRVNAVAPAVIKTKFAKALYEGREEEVAAKYPLARLGNPEDVAGPVTFLLSDDAAWITGQTIVIDGGGTLATVG
ncbi:MAG: SDR family oxidoreductase [Salinibacterium sp.]|nr:SDR family oxidoreductase [Salinibacterium sp.]MBF0671997.1 SDR family oxidoreductase [Salinibacterium sp.]